MTEGRNFECSGDICPCKIIGPPNRETRPIDEEKLARGADRMLALIAVRKATQEKSQTSDQGVAQDNIWVPNPDAPKEPRYLVDMP